MNIGIVGSDSFDNIEKLINVIARHFSLRDINAISALDSDSQGAAVQAKIFATTILHCPLHAHKDYDSLIEQSNTVVCLWDGQSAEVEEIIQKTKVSKRDTFLIYF